MLLVRPGAPSSVLATSSDAGFLVAMPGASKIWKYNANMSSTSNETLLVPSIDCSDVFSCVGTVPTQAQANFVEGDANGHPFLCWNVGS